MYYLTVNQAFVGVKLLLSHTIVLISPQKYSDFFSQLLYKSVVLHFMITFLRTINT
jgi:hypothetical protein